MILFSLTFIVRNFYFNGTIEIPAFGGTYVEALSESPHNLNPILATNDADRDLSRIIFSSLLKYNDQGELVPDLAASYSVSKDGKTYTVKLKEKVAWQDGEPFSSEDVIFTINAVQNPEYASPLRTGWQGAKAEAIDANTVVITLKSSYSSFSENLALLGIIPKHIWSKILPQNFPLTDFNLKPIGTGPYKFLKLQKDTLGRITSINLTANAGYFGNFPLIKNLAFKFYLSEEEAVSAYNRKEVDGILLQTAQNKSQIRGLKNSTLFSLPSLRIYAVFFNTDDPILKDKSTRQALNYAVDREEILGKILDSEGKITAGPIPPGMPGSSPEIVGYEYNPQKASEILEKNGWKKNDQGTYQKKLSSKDKEPTLLKITVISAKSVQLAATMVQDYLKNIGIESELKIVPLSELQQNYLKTKNYSAILIGESYTGAIDPYIFWHSAAVKDQGLNLSLYTNKKVDAILENVRQISDPIKKAGQLQNFQKLVIEDAPAIFLYSPNYIYIVKNTVKNIGLKSLSIPSNRFSNINKWNLETERIWK